ncbi:cell division protein FtsZ [Anseongella ginsenosidimutans]|uniref:Cell division protein FtsZ n=1 Tax=Anseongella ginsenosidimutans TaxID=496056 RepID=A0A4R3L1S9_9SPHI|nr:cell division protein FtsZ [Anseongella ginsenosidimutans]QEC50972.1 cell division protein FtsZ [Anseongella ginsenosidimutans]TCS90382.1 cell division protein FtsZ [Anseongella ginsenosidimutans]
MKFEMLKDKASIIKVIGVGGGGGNAVNHMFNQGINGVDFVVCNTDSQALEMSPVPNKVQLGSSLTEGRGAGSIPEVGKNSAIENIEQIKDFLGSNTKMVFITAGMGGGTGTGASPIIAQAAKELGILTVGIVTTPFSFEGKRRRQQAEEGLSELKEHVDTLLVISNDRLREMYGNLSLSNAFAEADNILTTAAKGIAEIITLPGYINVDFEDVKTVMTDGGVAIMGSSATEGQNRARRAAEGALNSPLLNDSFISGARYILLNITSGNQEVLLEELTEITDYIQEQSGSMADMIWGHCYDESLGDAISVTIIATGFKTRSQKEMERKPGEYDKKEPKKMSLIAEEDAAAMLAPATGKGSAEPAESEPRLKTGDAFGMENPNTAGPASTPLMDNSFKIGEPYLKGAPESSLQPFRKTESPRQGSIFDDATWEKKEEEVTVSNDVTVTIEPVQAKAPDMEPEANAGEGDIEEQLQRSRERVMRLKDLSLKLRSSNGLSELENEPAYKRRNMNLNKVPHSSETQLSRFTVSDDDGEIRPNNSFLHDNVD